MYDAINTLASKERERQRIAILVEQHVSSGNPVTTLTGFTPKPMPSRRDYIDPDTVLHRRRRGLSALGRQRIREMTEAI